MDAVRGPLAATVVPFRCSNVEQVRRRAAGGEGRPCPGSAHPVAAPGTTCRDVARARSGIGRAGTEPAFSLPMKPQRPDLSRDHPLARSWLRCQAAGLQRHQALPERTPRPLPIVAPRGAGGDLPARARPVLAELQRQLASSSTAVALADNNGWILHVQGEGDLLKRLGALHLAAGYCWSEPVMGSNAIGTALVDKQVVEVAGNGHFLQRHAGLTSVAVPLLGGHAGVLALIWEAPLVRLHARALMEMAAAQLEAELIDGMGEAMAILRLQGAMEAVPSPWGGLLALAGDGRVLAVNSRAAAALELPDPVGRSFSQCFAGSWAMLLERAGRNPEADLSLTTRSGLQYQVRLRLRGNPWSPPAACRGLDDLGQGDGRVADAIRRAARIVDRGITLLIQGETGCGKEWFAQAFHHSSQRCRGPFVAVNCAAIPPSLIEAELFGYVDGAFTGARRLGARGKIREADGGTLFLDEIGDMPLTLQSVLLRVLESRRVTPLGASDEAAVDVAVVCASHQSLAELVEQGRFRADLYFRLSGMTVTLPPLRERSDFAQLARRVLQEESRGRRVTLAPTALACLGRYHWPGNLRQLRNVLRLGVALLGDGEVLGEAELPAEIVAAGISPAPADGGLRGQQQRLIRAALARHGGNISAAARDLGITRTTLYRKLAAESAATAQSSRHEG